MVTDRDTMVSMATTLSPKPITETIVIIESYSGFLGALQNIVMNSYLLDIIPTTRRAEYISIINGFNGLVYCGHFFI